MKKHNDIGFDLVLSIIPANSRVLDLGCGDGSLLVRLQNENNVRGSGVEISEDGVSRCVEKGLYCYQGDIDEGLSDYSDHSFEYVILNQTIQNTKKPEYVLNEIMRIGKRSIISFPNFGYISSRLQLLFNGVMPKNILFPYEWYESPDIHMLTLKNFRQYCSEKNYNIEIQSHFNMAESGKSKVVKLFPDIFAQYGFFVLDGEKFFRKD